MSDVVDAAGPTELSGAGTAAAERGELSPGDRAGEYRIVQLLGKGGMGEVYEGIQDAIGKRVAVKVIRHVLAGDRESRERLMREARAANRVDHRGVLDVFSAGHLEDGRLFLVMDLLQGRSLREALEDGPLGVADAAALMHEVCDAVGAAHAAGIVHRDLKPDNIFLVGTGDSLQVFVLDFGIARLIEDAAKGQGLVTLTARGAWIGTPAYMAPEQWSSEGASPRSDVYALGAVAYEALSGSPPYRADSVPALMEKHFHAEPPTLGGRFPAALDQVLARAMAKEPADRFADAAELGRAIVDAAGAAVGAPTVRGGRAARARGLGPALAGALVVGLAGAGVLGFRALGGSDGDDRQADETPPPATMMSITSTPSGARVWIDGDEIGQTPLRHPLTAGAAAQLRLSKPGYLPVTATAIPGEGAQLHYDLSAPVGFEGVWQIDSGELRSFRRDGDRVACYRLEVADGPLEHLRFFEFLPSDDATVRFAASAEAVDPRAPNEPSCRRELAAEYRYEPTTDTLELRRQGDRIDFVDGKCVRLTVQWGEFQPATRIAARSASSDDLIFSSAGAGHAAAADAVTSNGSDAPVPQEAPAPGKKGSAPPPEKGSEKSIANPLAGSDLEEEKAAAAGAKPSNAPQAIEPPPQKQKKLPVQQKKAPAPDKRD